MLIIISFTNNIQRFGEKKGWSQNWANLLPGIARVVFKKCKNIFRNVSWHIRYLRKVYRDVIDHDNDNISSRLPALLRRCTDLHTLKRQRNVFFGIICYRNESFMSELWCRLGFFFFHNFAQKKSNPNGEIFNIYFQ